MGDKTICKRPKATCRYHAAAAEIRNLSEDAQRPVSSNASAGKRKRVPGAEVPHMSTNYYTGPAEEVKSGRVDPGPAEEVQSGRVNPGPAEEVQSGRVNPDAVIMTVIGQVNARSASLGKPGDIALMGAFGPLFDLVKSMYNAGEFDADEDDE